MSESGQLNGNTAGVEGRPSVIIYETQSGVICHITPINLATARAIQLKAEELFPYPKPEDYRKPLENTFGDTPLLDKPEENPEYVKLCQAVDHERQAWRDRAIFLYAVRFPKYPTHEDLENAFRPRLAELKQIAKLDADNDFEAILLHIVLSGDTSGRNKSGELVSVESEFSKIIKMAIQTIALTPDEVTIGARFFRPKV